MASASASTSGNGVEMTSNECAEPPMPTPRQKQKTPTGSPSPPPQASAEASTSGNCKDDAKASRLGKGAHTSDDILEAQQLTDPHETPRPQRKSRHENGHDRNDDQCSFHMRQGIDRLISGNSRGDDRYSASEREELEHLVSVDGRGDDEWNVNIHEQVKNLLDSGDQVDARANPTRFHRVPEHLRSINPGSYTPRVISLGLYRSIHNTTNSLDVLRNSAEIEKFQVHLAYKTCRRKCTWDALCNEVLEDPSAVRMMYESCDHFENKVVQSILTLDAIFLMHFLVHDNGSGDRSPHWKHEVSNAPWLALQTSEVYRDIFFLENQIPFTALLKVPKIVAETGDAASSELSASVSIEIQSTLESDAEKSKHLHNLIKGPILKVSSWLPGYRTKVDNYYEAHPDPSEHLPATHHLLGYLYEVLTSAAAPSAKAHIPEPDHNWIVVTLGTLDRIFSSKIATVGIRRVITVHLDEIYLRLLLFLLQLVIKLLKLFFFSTPSSYNLEAMTLSNLGNAGIRVKAGALGIREIEFDSTSAVLRLPSLFIHYDCTESLLQNLAVFEYRRHCMSGSEEICPLLDYLYLLDTLVDSAADVRLLRAGGVLSHNFGSDEDVARMLNGIHRGFVWRQSKEMAKIYNSLRLYRNNDWNKAKVEFWATYLQRPWLAISVMAATVVVAASILQTVYSVLSFYRRK